MNAAYVRQLLDDLGNTPDEIAAKLKRLGCKGFACDAGACPVSRYLEKNGVEHPSVCSTDIGWEINDHLKPPGPVTDFVCAFDSYAYPELLENERIPNPTLLETT